MKREVIVACDFSSQTELFNFLDQFEVKPFIKVGMELFYKEGPLMVTKLKEMGCKIFLDLKLHDIPNTVYKAMKNIASLNVDIINVHASGGVEMMKAAKKAIDEVNPNIILIGVTVLTSIDEAILNNELLISKKLNEVVYQYCKNVKDALLDGVVCSPFEANIAKELGLISITPGIRFSDSVSDDQKRIATPKMAYELGSDFIVVGRPITNAVNPYDAYLKCVKEFN